jgi:beta-glucosidase/6-phospho-beta-glucosidase/beta-galactosidase/ABC-type amino acid transport substrate-binding protein
MSNVLTTLFGEHPLPPFPPSFLFGVANSDHQCEAYDPECEDIRDVWERLRGLMPRGRAIDFARRYPEDVGLAQRLGCTAFRFSVSWARVEPAPGCFDDAALEHYHRLVTAIRAAAMEPILTLHHFTWPLHVEQRGGMLAADFPDWFAAYADAVAARLGDDVRYWLTFNEPGQMVVGYIKPWWERNYFAPPGLPDGASLAEQTEAVGRLIPNLFRAHTAARRAIRGRNPAALVGVNPNVLGLPGWLQRWINWSVTRIRRPKDLARAARQLAVRPMSEGHGDVDVVIATLTRTPERAGQVLFSESYFNGGARLLVLADSPAGRPLDLAGRVVAVVRGTTAEPGVRTAVPEARALAFRDYGAALRALDQGQADALLADDSVLRGLMKPHPDRYRMIGPALTREPYAAAVAPGAGDWLDVVDEVIRRFKDQGEWAASYARNIGRAIPRPPAEEVRALAASQGAERVRAAYRSAVLGEPDGALALARPGRALRRIQDRGYVVAGVRDDAPGFGYVDPSSGELSGLEIDLARALARRIFGASEDDSRVRFRVAKPSQRLGLVRSFWGFLDPLLKQYSTLSTIIAGHWWHLGMAGKMAPFLCPPECVGQQDFVGLDYYWGTPTLSLEHVSRLLDSAAGRFDKAPVWPDALYGFLRDCAALFPNWPVLVVENGCVDEADGVDRATYLRRHVREVQRAVADGVNVIGYLCWSLTSNREWGLPFGPGNDFGLYHIDLDGDPDLQRRPTLSAHVYSEIIKARGV